MTDLPARRYNEREVARLLKRASELQRSSSSAHSPSGLTLDELEDIAKEAGLDVTLLRRAAYELDNTGPLNLGERLAGGPLRVVFERVLPFEASESSCALLVPAIEAAFGGPGQLGHVARTFSWHASRPNSGRTQQVRVSMRDGQTMVRIEESFGALAGGLYGGVLGGVGGGVGIGAGGALGAALGSAVLMVGVPAAVIGATYWGVRAGFRKYVEIRRRALEHLLGDIADALTTDRTSLGPAGS